MKKSGIYRILNKQDNKCYIGSSADIARRFCYHQKRLENKRHDNSHLQRAWDKYGKDAFGFIILFYCNKKYLITFEQSMIDFYDSANRRKGYNICSIAGSCAGVKQSKKTILKIKITRAERKLNEKQGELMKGNTRWKARVNYTTSEETKKKLSIAHIGKSTRKGTHHSEEAKTKMSLAKKGKPSPHKGKKRSPEAILRRIGMKYKKKNKEIIQETRTLGLAV
jgi:hypothetical protein